MAALSRSASAGPCGGHGQRPCYVIERIPSCDAGLVEDFTRHRCVPRSEIPKSEFERLADSVVRQHKPMLEALIRFGTSLAQPGNRALFDSGEFLRMVERGDLEGLAARIGLPRFQNTMREIGDAMPKTLMVGVVIDGGVGIGGSMERGVAFPLAPGARARSYRTFGVSMGLITGGSGSIALSLARATPSEIVGESRGLAAGAGKSVVHGLAVGASIGFWFKPLREFPGAIGFDLRSLEALGIAVGVGASVLPVDLRGSSALTQVAVDAGGWKADACGATGLRPCHVVERVPSCDPGLREDFLRHECIR